MWRGFEVILNILSAAGALAGSSVSVSAGKGDGGTLAIEG
jgi:hypothetical protein